MDIADYEKDILRYCIKEKEINKKELCHKIKEETQAKKLIKLEDSGKINSTYIMELIMAWMIIYQLLTIAFFVEVSGVGMLLFISYFMTFLSIPAYKIIQSKIAFVVRTKNGVEISGKLRGLRRYIKEFSRIQDGSVENMYLFDDYVIYAIILNLPGKLNKEVKEIYTK